jgi:hypothetical protein
MSRAQIKAVEAANEESGESVNLSAVFQARQSVRVKLLNGIEAIRLATIAASDANVAVEETANAPVILAAQAVAGGLIGKDELSEALCEAFGRGQDTKSGKASKTPIGYGLTFRKRAVCLSEAIGIKEGEIKPDAFPKWAQDKDSETIGEIVESVLSGEMGAFVGYNELTKKA